MICKMSKNQIIFYISVAILYCINTIESFPTHECIEMFKCPVEYNRFLKNWSDPYFRTIVCGSDNNTDKVWCPIDFSSLTISTERPTTERPTTTTTTTTTKPIATTKQSDIVSRVIIPEPTDFSSIQSHRNIGLINRDGCGESETDRIHLGTIAGLTQFKWTVLLTFESTLGEPDFQTMCGGSLIADQYVLSAAHCVTDTLANRYKLYSVILGEHNQTTEEDCLPDKSLCHPPVQEIEVESYKLHELYSDELSVNDIMIIKLKHPVEYKSNIKTICLPTNENQLITKALNKKKLTITGWGRTEFNKTSDVLLYANIPYLTLDECKARMKKEKINIILHPSHICAGGADLRDACKGDSGGPLSGGILIIKEGELPKVVDYQFGIVSTGIGCSFQGSAPGIYTNVAYYMNWILDQMD